MSIKKYKTLKSISTILKVTNIFKSSPFFCFIQVKHLNHNDWLILKQLICSFELNIFVCKNTSLEPRKSVLNLPKCLWGNLNNGNLVILYSNKSLNLFLINKFFSADQLLKKIKLLLLVSYCFGRFLFPKDFSKILYLSKDEVFYNLICVLQNVNYDIVNNLIFFNKLLLSSLNRK